MSEQWFCSTAGTRLCLSYNGPYTKIMINYNDLSRTSSPLQSGTLESQFFPTQRILSLPNKSWLLSQEYVTSSPSIDRALFPCNLPLFGVLGSGQIPVQPKTLSTFDAFGCVIFFYPFAQSTQNLLSLTFADWRWIVPFSVIARNGRGTNPCVAMCAIKHHRGPMSEAFSWSTAMSWWGEFGTRCYVIQQDKSRRYCWNHFLA